MPSVLATEIGEFIRKIEETLESSDTFDITFALQRRTTDQADQAINDGFQIWFEGDGADALGASPTNPWQVPSGW